MKTRIVVKHFPVDNPWKDLLDFKVVERLTQNMDWCLQKLERTHQKRTCVRISGFHQTCLEVPKIQASLTLLQHIRSPEIGL